MKLASILPAVCAISTLTSVARACVATAQLKKARTAATCSDCEACAIHCASRRTNAQTPWAVTNPGSLVKSVPTCDTGALDRS